jgi:hypothetical protein
MSQSFPLLKAALIHISEITISGGLAYRTMYPLMDATLTHYIDTKHAWKVEYNGDGTPIIIDKIEN